MSQNAVNLIKALADPARIKILKLLSAGQELSCQEISGQIDLSQPAFSHHIGKLSEAGILIIRKVGTQHFYRLNLPFLSKAGINLKKLLIIN